MKPSLRRCALGAALAASALALLAACTMGGPTNAVGGALPDYAAIIASPDRSDADRQTDVRRKQPHFLAFTRVRAGMKVLDLGADAGYSTELMARTVGPSGTVYGQNSGSAGHADQGPFRRAAEKAGHGQRGESRARLR